MFRQMNQKCSHVSSGGSILATWLWALNAQWFQKMFSNLVCQSALMKGDSPMVGWAICLVCKLKQMQIKDEKKSIWIWFVKNAFAWKLQCCERSDAHLQSLSIYSFPHNKWLSRNWGWGGGCWALSVAKCHWKRSTWRPIAFIWSFIINFITLHHRYHGVSSEVLHVTWASWRFNVSKIIFLMEKFCEIMMKVFRLELKTNKHAI